MVLQSTLKASTAAHPGMKRGATKVWATCQRSEAKRSTLGPPEAPEDAVTSSGGQSPVRCIRDPTESVLSGQLFPRFPLRDHVKVVTRAKLKDDPQTCGNVWRRASEVVEGGHRPMIVSRDKDRCSLQKV
jgi:hypothetical protein